MDATDVTNATINGIGNVYYKNEILTATVVPDKQYALPQSIIVEGDSELQSYDSTTGEFKIRLNTKCIIRVVAIYSPVPVAITSILTHCTLSQSKTYNVYDVYTETITADYNYLLPDSIQVEGLESWNYNPQTGLITGYIIEDVEITAVCAVDESRIATYTFEGLHCTSSQPASLLIGDDFNITITPDNDYKLPEEIIVMGLASGYTYVQSTGVVSGKIGSSAVFIACDAEEIIDIVSFSFTGTNCSTAFLTQYEEKTVINLKITPEFSYELPDSYIATGLSNISYNKETGEFTATIVENATLEIVATKITTQYNYTVTAENCTSNPSGVATYADKVEVTVTPKTAYSLPLALTSYSGCKDVTYDPLTGKITFVVLGEVNIELSAVYTPKEFSFSLSGSHVTCDAPMVVYEASEFSYTLRADKDYLLPNEISCTGLDNLQYNPQTGTVIGIVTGNVSINCNCIFDTTNKSKLIINCTNCSINNVPEYIEKGSEHEFSIICDYGYSLTQYSVEAVTGVYSYELYGSILFFEGENEADIVEINITAVVFLQSIDFTGEHCNATIVGGDTVNSIGFVRFTADSGYILPEKEDLSYEGFEIITYNTDTQILTFRRTGEEASLSVTAIQGEKTYNSAITVEDAEKLIFPNGKYQDILNSFSNVTMTEVRNFDLSDGFVDSTNDVVVAKSDFNYFSYNTIKTNYYGVLDNIYNLSREGTVYLQDNDGWIGYDGRYGPDNQYISHMAEVPILAMRYSTPQYDEQNRCYAAVNDMLPCIVFFKNGRLIGSLIEMMGYFNYCEFYNYETTTVELPYLPVMYSANVILGDSYYQFSYGTINRKYAIGDTLEFKFGVIGGNAFDPHVEVDGLKNWTLDKSTRILKGTVTGPVTIRLT